VTGFFTPTTGDAEYRLRELLLLLPEPGVLRELLLLLPEPGVLRELLLLLPELGVLRELLLLLPELGVLRELLPELELLPEPGVLDADTEDSGDGGFVIASYQVA
jgi:hypothetical protein